ETARSPVMRPEPDLLETVRGPRPPLPPQAAAAMQGAAPPPAKPPRAQTEPPIAASGEIVVKPKGEKTTAPGHAAAPRTGTMPAKAMPDEDTPAPSRVITTPVPAPLPPMPAAPAPRIAGSIPVASEADDDDEVTRPEHDAQEPSEEAQGSIL